jgi:hypothetical protein
MAVKLQYTPDRGQTNPLGRLPPLKIALEVKDNRVVPEPKRVGDIWEDHSQYFWERRMFQIKVFSEQNPVTLLSEAMTYALETNGHTVLQEGSPAAPDSLRVSPAGSSDQEFLWRVARSLCDRPGARPSVP